MKKKTAKRAVKTDNKPISGNLIGDIRSLIETARHNVAVTVNAGLTILYWQIGNRICQNILKQKRGEYGKEIVATLSQELADDYGNNFNEKNLRRMIQFAEVFSDKKIVVSLIRQLSWTHFIALIPLKNDLQRDFYAEMCRVERWSVRTLRKKIDGMLYERTAISKKPEELVKKELSALREEDRLTPDLVFRDPYFLDFLGLKDTYSEKDLETAILREMESFILELGVSFSFVARQKRITVDNEDYYLDLLFFHRKLKRLIAIELKLGKFKPAHKGQMELYLRWLEKYEKEPGEETPLGLILCAGKASEQIELLQLDNSGIKVAEYMTELPKRKLLEQKLHKAVELARKRLEAKPA
ncbi:MAG: PDDEXK nuclease domain-containing protein [Deltaproteobacteria bacterium]|jgi:predicted nuclease of restriction endonuclease-like (RecB) superfamily|nr:PDDEXK nuclease domain-containing protein [Deltaproteobacteria bacterium]